MPHSSVTLVLGLPIGLGLGLGSVAAWFGYVSPSCQRIND